MSKREKIIEILKKNFPYLKENFAVEKIGLFGSLAKGIDRKNSDIDILVEFKNPIGLKFMEFAEYMEKLLSRKVDILTSEGIRAIRVKKVAREIERDMFYV